ncbi:MAG: MarC family protein [Paludibacter sp.]|nr:MarC family protein [Paludibacter sp.]
MTEHLTYALTVFTGFFAIMNPIANTPIFLGLVDNKDEETKRKIARTSTLTAFIIVFAFIILGKYIFEIFSITIPAFKITGGILIFYVGFEMLMSQKSKVHNTKNDPDEDSIAISPLAIPILAGPGTIVTAMNFASNASLFHVTIVVVDFALIVLLTYIAFRLSDKIVKKIGQNMIAVISKIMGLIIGIIGTGMVVEGIKLSFNLK